MNFVMRDFFVSRCKADHFRIKIDKEIVIVKHPNENLEYESKEVYLELYNKAIGSGMIKHEDVDAYLIYKGIMTEEEIEEIEVRQKQADLFKKKIAQCQLKSNTKLQLKSHLKIAQERIKELTAKRSSIDYMTCEGYAEYFKNLYIVEHSSYYPSGEKYSFDVSPEVIMSKYLSSMMTMEQIREVAKTSPWTEYWSTSCRNGSIFNTTNLSLEQQLLLMWSITYENVQQSYDCPSSEIINDDDAFDGWLAIRREKSEKEKGDNELSNSISKNKKINNAAEVFVKVETKEDASKIEGLNSFGAKKAKENRYNQLKALGEINYKDFNDIKLKSHMEANKGK